MVVEMRSVNHRFAEVVLRMPREWMGLEERVRKMVLAQIGRGRVEVFVTVGVDADAAETMVSVNQGLLTAALHLLRDVSASAQVDFEQPSIGALLALPGLFVATEAPGWPKDGQELFIDTVNFALQELTQMRRKEGEYLVTHLEARLRDLDECLLHIAARAPAVAQLFRSRLKERLQEVLGEFQVDAGRIAIETAIFAEKTSIEEEVQRLHSHVQQFRSLLPGTEGAVGRRLDFLLQEMHREANTIGAKAVDLDISDGVLAAKHAIEQLREQAQNVE